jgi:hypothetical protein
MLAPPDRALRCIGASGLPFSSRAFEAAGGMCLSAVDPLFGPVCWVLKRCVSFVCASYTDA